MCFVSTNAWRSIVYVNYRPVFGLNKRHFEESFGALLNDGDNISDDPSASAGVGGGVGGKNKLLSLSRDDLIQCLQTLGERMTSEEVKDCLDALIGPPTLTATKGVPYHIISFHVM